MIQATYKNDLNEYKKFMLYTVFVVNNKKITFITFEVLAIIALVLSVCFINALWFVIGLMFAVIGGVFFLINYLLIGSKTEKLVKSYKDFYKITNKYTFYEDKFDVITAVGKKENTGSVNYKDMYMVAENKDFFYLYANKTVGIIIKKSGVDDVNALREIFIKSFDKKHCKCKK